MSDIMEDGYSEVSFLRQLSNVKYDTIRRNSQKSINWLVNKIKKASSNEPSLVKSRPKIGRMYVYVYDAKYKDTLPYWDANPIVIPVVFGKGKFSGINFHYLPVEHRKVLLRTLMGFSNKRFKKSIRMSYQMLVGLSNTIWKKTYHTYLYSHMKTRLIEIPMDEWIGAISLPIANFQKKSASYVWKH